MATKLFVGSLAYSVTDEELRTTFEAVGAVESAKVITDRDTGRSRGFGFVEMTNDAEAQEAIKQLNEKELSGRRILVNEARPQQPR
jgi:cold-inducible RNA-binding protein